MNVQVQNVPKPPNEIFMLSWLQADGHSKITEYQPQVSIKLVSVPTAYGCDFGTRLDLSVRDKDTNQAYISSPRPVITFVSILLPTVM